MALPFPGRPVTSELEAWGSSLLEVDGYVAGYAVRVEKGSLDPREMRDIEALVRDVEDLCDSIGEIRVEGEEESTRLNEFTIYVLALARLVRELASLAQRSGGPDTR
ncbi:hypothetical protein ABTY59_28320 [Streptomyces sp. NPDC096079]|uniref:hypothetical protein n=1 Tax=Streptomyces sp. NPDC096079 TaxID=3155820 RepID=UPI003326FBD3